MSSLVRRGRPDLVDVFRRYFDVDLEKSWMRVEEFVDDGTLVVRAELPDIDPDKDVEISVVADTLTIDAERRVSAEHKDKDSYRSEFQYGSFHREIPLPAGCRESDVTASYTDGVLEVRVPMGEVPKPEAVKVPVRRG